MIINCVASYKEETKLLVLASQSPQNGVIFNALPKTCQPPSAEELLAIHLRFMTREQNVVLVGLNRDLIERP
jgi:hypothetical protein